MWFGTVFGGSRCQRVQCLRFSFSLARQARCDFARPDVISRPEMMSVSDASVGSEAWAGVIFVAHFVSRVCSSRTARPGAVCAALRAT